MKFKKILLFILIFLFFLLLSSNVNAFVVSDSGVEKYYLPDLPSSVSDSYNKVFIFNNDTNEVVLFAFSNNDKLGYDRLSNLFCLFNIDKKLRPNNESDALLVFSCQLTLSNDKYIGTNWNKYSHTSCSVNLYNFNNNNFTTISGILYPCYKEILIDNLFTDVNWEEDIIIAGKNTNDILLFIPQIKYNDYVFSRMDDFSENNDYYFYRPFYNSENFIKYLVYKYNIETFSFEYYTTCDSTNCYPLSMRAKENFIYFSKDLLSISDGSVLYKNTNNIFSSFFNYNSFPYILNGAEDLAKGNDDIVIMPRGF